MNKDSTIKVIDRILDGGIETWHEAFMVLCMLCQEHEISLRFNYCSGWFAKPKEGSDNPHEMGEPYLDKDAQGFTVEVGLVSYANDDGGEAYYAKPSWAVHDGLRLLKSVLEESHDAR